MPRYVLLLHEESTGSMALSPEQIQAIIQKYKAWGDRLRAAGKMDGGEKLHAGGRVMRGVAPRTVVTDGPFIETKEVIGGFFIINAKNYEEAVALTRDCPHLEYGTAVELREVEPT